MNNKVEELVEWVARLITGEPSQIQDEKGSWIDDPLHEMDVSSNIELAKQILSHPDLALIDRGNDNQAWVVIPLAEALKEIKDEVQGG